ncbi:helix-turn-helix transcriptional regulator [Pseudonocardia sp. TRM90224]|uniref:helix-turn-helix transcriptional regulator n=1 Tax=Pseudonocardia sp. TRM90224 TaxID=2812678 RepID=UPI001E5D84D3|nr:AAA family ATPase [Pseudonocardia sp. TRM90224]
MSVHPAGRAIVGRTAELEQLHEAMRIAASGRSQVVVIGGEAGVGKTRLIDEFVADVRDRDVRVLTGNCVELGAQGLPLVPFTSAVRALARQVGVEALSAMLPTPDGLARLLPERDEPVATSSGWLPPPAEIFHIYPALLDRLSAETPVLLVVEDLHWADRSTRELLDVLARGLRDARLCVVATYRTDGTSRGDPLRAFLAELDRVPAHRINLERLSRSETEHLIVAALGERAQVALIDRVFARSGGNPFFVEELVRAERGDDATGLGDSLLGDSLLGLLLSRIDGLSEAAQGLVRTAAIGGERVPHELLAAVAEIPDGAQLTGVLREVVDAHVLLPEGDGYAFRHALVREAAVGSLLPGERTALHRRFATALEAAPGLFPLDRIAAELAHHWSEAGEAGRALPALLRAAATAHAMHAYAEQCQMLVRALEFYAQMDAMGIDHVEVLEQAIVASVRAGIPELTAQLTQRALAELDPLREPQRVAPLLARWANCLLVLDRNGALNAAEEAARLMPADESAARVAVLETHGCVLGLVGRGGEAESIFREAMRIAERRDFHEARISAWTGLCNALVNVGDQRRALAELAAVRAFAEQRGAVRNLPRILAVTSHLLWAIGRHHEAVDVAATGAALARRVGAFPSMGAAAATFGAASMISLGRWAEAEAALAEVTESRPQGIWAAFPQYFGGVLALAVDDLDAADRRIEKLRAALGWPADGSDNGMLVSMLAAEIALHRGDLEDAAHHVTGALGAMGSGVPSVTWILLATGARVVARAHADERHEWPAFKALAEELSALVTTVPADAPRWRAYAMQIAAELRGITAESGPAWADVVDAWHAVEEPLSVAVAQLRAGESATHRAEASKWLRAAADAGRMLGAPSLGRAVEAAASKAHADLHGAFGLTRREVQVLRLVSGGCSNRDIGAQLHITANTAGVHVSRILAKLGVANRTEAAAAAHRLRLFETG